MRHEFGGFKAVRTIEIEWSGTESGTIDEVYTHVWYTLCTTKRFALQLESVLNLLKRLSTCARCRHVLDVSSYIRRISQERSSTSQIVWGWSHNRTNLTVNRIASASFGATNVTSSRLPAGSLEMTEVSLNLCSFANDLQVNKFISPLWSGDLQEGSCTEVLYTEVFMPIWWRNRVICSDFGLLNISASALKRVFEGYRVCGTRSAQTATWNGRYSNGRLNFERVR